MKAGKISYAGVGVTVGGLVGFLGVLVGWFSYSYPLNGGTATVNLSGTADWTGTAALVAGIGSVRVRWRLRPDPGRQAPPDDRHPDGHLARRSCS